MQQQRPQHTLSYTSSAIFLYILARRFARIRTKTTCTRIAAASNTCGSSSISIRRSLVGFRCEGTRAERTRVLSLNPRFQTIDVKHVSAGQVSDPITRLERYKTNGTTMIVVVVVVTGCLYVG
mmetsp:Transcript_85279/g.127784  ORF Transcript_85279/g.127784 Transcript_85279/m.127784 type:complete len:123 (+) Transcript_85279:385-753(+)